MTPDPFAPFVPSSAHRALFYLPAFRHAMEATEAVARAVELVRPEVIALEMPSALREPFADAVARLPCWSVLVYEGGGASWAHVVHPVDPVVEAARVALEKRIPWEAVDADLPTSDVSTEPAPDLYAARSLGLAGLVERLRPLLDGGAEPQDRAREIHMAHRIARHLEAGRSVLAVVHPRRMAGIDRELREPQPLPLTRERIANPVLFNLDPRSLAEVVPSWPLMDALFELRRVMPPPLPGAEQGKKPAAHQEQGERSPFTVLQGGRETPQESLRRVFLEMLPDARVEDAAYAGLDRWRILKGLYAAAGELYRLHTGEEVRPWQRQVLDRFLFKCARFEHRLLPDLFQVLSAARGAVDDNFAWEVMALATYFPWQSEFSDLPTTRLSAEELRLGTRSLRIRRQLPRSLRRLQRFPVQQHPMSEDPGEWEKEFEDAQIVSYPPEDLAVEDFGRQLKERGRGILEAELTRVEPFSVSFLDGLDLRETLRHHHEGRLWVRETRLEKGNADTVVMIFDPDPRNERHPFRMTWLGEHENESDMAFYSTHPMQNVVGPGISRCEYGGFMLIFPPMQLYDVWRIQEYRRITQRPDELLLVAALDYSKRREVIHVAAKPPHPRFQPLARALGKRIVHIPLGSFDPERVKRLRTFHILNGRHRRAEVKKYLW
jgi:hypothetical protein